MTEQPNNPLDPAHMASDEGPLRLILTAWLEPVGGLDRFQPAGFPEIGHVIYDAPRSGNAIERVCIIDSPASMANHLESVCQRSRWDPELVSELKGMPYLRCVTDPANGSSSENEPNKNTEVVVTSLTEGHRIASTYFLDGRRMNGDSKPIGNGDPFKGEFATECGIVLKDSNKAHPPPEAWWKVFSTIFKYDPNSLVHGVLFPQWQIKIPRVLTAHLEAFGAGRVDSSGVKFDRLGKTTSGQPIFAKDDETAREIRATFVLDLALLRSFGRANNGDKDRKGLTDEEKKFLVELALWKIGRLVSGPFRYRSGCDLQCTRVVGGIDKEGDDLRDALGQIRSAVKGTFQDGGVTDIYWPRNKLYRAEAEDDADATPTNGGAEDDSGSEE